MAEGWTEGQGWVGVGGGDGRLEGGAGDGVELLHQPLQAGHLLRKVVLFVHLEEEEQRKVQEQSWTSMTSTVEVASKEEDQVCHKPHPLFLGSLAPPPNPASDHQPVPKQVSNRRGQESVVGWVSTRVLHHHRRWTEADVLLSAGLQPRFWVIVPLEDGVHVSVRGHSVPGKLHRPLIGPEEPSPRRLSQRV